MADSANSQYTLTKRRFLLFGASLAALYPIIRFLGFSIPRKPRTIEINTIIPEGGYHLGSEYILFDNGTKAWALSRRCTHLGCTINFHEKEQILECPCHQSRFSLEGLVLHGPAQKALTRYTVERLKENGGYIVTI